MRIRVEGEGEKIVSFLKLTHFLIPAEDLELYKNACLKHAVANEGEKYVQYNEPIPFDLERETGRRCESIVPEGKMHIEIGSETPDLTAF